MEIKCLDCGTLVPQTPGKRKKEYCGPTCRTKYWKKKKQAASGLPIRKPGRPPKEKGLVFAKPRVEKEKKPTPTKAKDVKPKPQEVYDAPEFKNDFERLMWESEQEVLNKKIK